MSTLRVKPNTHAVVQLPIEVPIIDDQGNQIGTRQGFQSVALIEDQPWDSDDPLIGEILDVTATKLSDWFQADGDPDAEAPRKAKRAARVETADRADLR